jgi:hypothetical protein
MMWWDRYYNERSTWEQCAKEMAKQFNGIFRTWMSVKQADEGAPPVIWGHCIVHLSNPEFSGKVLHTSSVLEITEHKTFRVVETRNNYYALLGPELVMLVNSNVDPMTYMMQQRGQSLKVDAYASAAMNADRDCPKCNGTGVYRRCDRYIAICDLCCKHNQGWWQLEDAYGPNNGRWACKAGCGIIVDTPPLELEFLPRASA